jgi:hypothetical protein
VRTMRQEPIQRNATQVAACTAAAAHRRDHQHTVGAQCCHPHAVEVVHLGRRGVTVCHDCRADSGFLPDRQAERLAEEHRGQTRVVSVPLPRGAAA